MVTTGREMSEGLVMGAPRGQSPGHFTTTSTPLYSTHPSLHQHQQSCLTVLNYYILSLLVVLNSRGVCL